MSGTAAVFDLHLRSGGLLCNALRSMDARESQSRTAAEPGIDHQLVARANRGEAEAFEALYHRHKGWAVGVARRYTNDSDEALDILQETFAYFFGKFPGFELSAALRAFLFPVVKHVALSRKRKQRRMEDLGTVDEAHLAVHPTEPSEIDTLLAHLPETHREVVWLRFSDDMSLKDIAVALDIPLGTVKSRLHNGLEMIRQAHQELRSSGAGLAAGKGIPS